LQLVGYKTTSPLYNRNQGAESQNMWSKLEPELDQAQAAILDLESVK